MDRVRHVAFLALRVQVALASGRQILVIGVEIRIPSAQAPSARVVANACILHFTSLRPRESKERRIARVNVRVLSQASGVFRPLCNLFMTRSQFRDGILVSRHVSNVNKRSVIRVAMVTTTILIMYVVVTTSYYLMGLVVAKIPPRSVLRTNFGHVRFTSQYHVVRLGNLFRDVHLAIQVMVMRLRVFCRFVFSFVQGGVRVDTVEVAHLELYIRLVEGHGRPLFILLKDALVVGISVCKRPQAFSVVIHPMTVDGVLMVYSMRRNAAITIALVVTTVRPRDRHRRPWHVGLMAHLGVPMLRVPL